MNDDKIKVIVNIESNYLYIPTEIGIIYKSFYDIGIYDVEVNIDIIQEKLFQYGIFFDELIIE